MPTKCKTCNNPGIKQINRLLLAGTSQRIIANDHGLTLSSVQRHAVNCLAELAREQRELLGKDLFAGLTIVVDKIEGIEAQFANDGKLMIAAVEKRMGVLDMVAKLTGSYQQEAKNERDKGEMKEALEANLMEKHGWTRAEASIAAAKVLESDAVN